uniref:C2H2-type domain-containing protein n=1 Tax=Neolamprologus brichardi TaxID=32507 RepID=A0A3Q4HMH5_NEOBR
CLRSKHILVICDSPEGFTMREVQPRSEIQSSFLLQLLYESDTDGSNSQPCHHCGGGKAFRCDICGKTFNWQRSPKIHLRRHTGHKLKYCKECGKGFPTAGQLKTHKRVHTGEKPYKCRYCDKSFSHSANRNCHERTHMEGNYSCDQCDKSLENFSSYSEHKRSHVTNKLFHCYQCAKIFTSLSALCKHQRDHAGLKSLPSLDHGESAETERSSSGFRVRFKTLEIRWRFIRGDLAVLTLNRVPAAY